MTARITVRRVGTLGVGVFIGAMGVVAADRVFERDPARSALVHQGDLITPIGIDEWGWFVLVEDGQVVLGMERVNDSASASPGDIDMSELNGEIEVISRDRLAHMYVCGGVPGERAQELAAEAEKSGRPVTFNGRTVRVLRMAAAMDERTPEGEEEASHEGGGGSDGEIEGSDEAATSDDGVPRGD